MKTKKNFNILAIIVGLTFLVFLGFSFYQSKNVNNSTDGTSARRDTVYNNSNSGSMMGRGMMNGGMMGNGMMGRGMMNGGMMGQNNYSTNGNRSNNWVAPPSADNVPNPIKDIVKASREGKNIFETQCFTCHGTSGEGNGPAAATLNFKPANLTSLKVQKQSDGAIFWKITTGNAPMPSFRYALSSQQRWELVDYIRTLSN